MSKRKLNFKKTLNRLILFIGIGVVAHIIFVLATTEKQSLSYLGLISFGHLLLIVVLLVCPWLGYASRIYMWSRFLNEKITYKDAIRVVVTAEVASALSPTAVGGAPVKAALLLNRGYSHGSVGFMLTYGVVEDIIFYCSGIALASYFSSELIYEIGSSISLFFINHFEIITSVLIFFIIYIVAMVKKWIPEKLKISKYLPTKFNHFIEETKIKFSKSIRDMKSNFKLAVKHGKLRMLLSITILFLQWIAKFSVLIVILSAFGVDFEAIQVYIRQWVVYVTMLFIPTPGAAGGAEASFLVIFGESIPDEISYLVVSIWRLCTYYFILLGAVFVYIISTASMQEETIELEEIKK
jgi:uncharacterized protein (TIRG00374 family)